MLNTDMTTKLQAQLGSQASAFYKQILDLNVAPSQLDSTWVQITKLRTHLLNAHGIRPQAHRIMPSGGVSPQGQADPTNWKGELLNAYMKAIPKPYSKDMMRTHFDEVIGDKPGQPSYMCTLQLEGYSSVFQSGTPSQTKKLAEQAACRACLQSEFPQVYANCLAMGGGQKAAKRKVENTSFKQKVEDANPKCRLIVVMQMLMGRTATKDDVVFEHEKVVMYPGGPEQVKASVKFPNYDLSLVFEGALASDTKSAERSAAENALLALDVTGLDELRHAKKARQKEEKSEQRKMKEDLWTSS